MNEERIWTNLTKKEVVILLKKEWISVSITVIKGLFKKHWYVKRKLSKEDAMNNVEDRNEQFEKIEKLKEEYMDSDNPIISIDTKKKEYLGNFYRDWKVYRKWKEKVYDHDFTSFSDWVIIPHWIYDLKKNKGMINIWITKDTSEFSCDSFRKWWNEEWKIAYPKAKSILVLSDGWGSNSSRHHIFKEDLQKLSNELWIEIRMAHYPPYTSKYNPIEHRFFSHVTRACKWVVGSILKYDLKKEHFIKNLV